MVETDVVPPVVIPYERFLERRERRQRIARELGRLVVTGPGDPDVPVAAAMALPRPSGGADTRTDGVGSPKGLGPR